MGDKPIKKVQKTNTVTFWLFWDIFMILLQAFQIWTLSDYASMIKCQLI